MRKGIFTLTTRSSMELIDITHEVTRCIRSANMESPAICHLFNPHTTAALTINEGADPAVKKDIIEGLRQTVPMDLAYKHAEGNSPAHILASLLGSALTLFVENNNLVLGTWQKVYFCEFDGPRTREVHWRLLSD